MRLLFDPARQAANIKKHGFDFAELTIDFFAAAVVVKARDERFKAIGFLRKPSAHGSFQTARDRGRRHRFNAQREQGRTEDPRMKKYKTQAEFIAGQGYTREDWEEVSDNPEWTEEELARAKPFAEVFPEMAASIRRTRGKQKTPTKQQITLRIDRTVLDAFRATGRGWQGRMAEVLKSSIK